MFYADSLTMLLITLTLIAFGIGINAARYLLEKSRANSKQS